MTHDAETVEDQSQRNPGQNGARRTTTAAAAAVVGLIVLAAIGYWFLTLGPGQTLVSPAGSTVAEFSGEGDQTTDEFEVREGWAIHWENSGESFSFAITGDRDFGTVIDQSEPGSGVTSPVGAGAYRLEIAAEGPWAIRIVQGD